MLVESKRVSIGWTYVLIPVGVSEWNLLAVLLERLSLFFLVLSRLLSGSRRGCGSLLGLLFLLGLSIERADLQLGLVLLEDALIVVLPELLGGVLSSYALKDLLTTYDLPESARLHLDTQAN